MKTFSVDATQRTGTVRGRKSVKNSDGNFAEHLETGATADTRQMASVGSVVIEGLIGLQEYGDDARHGRREQAIDHGQSVLDQLELLRRDLLLGLVPAQRLRAITSTLQNGANLSADPRLKEILQEIELRAHVELAKLGEAF